jgi:transcriptional regulator with XRE-family HTH domain
VRKSQRLVQTRGAQALPKTWTISEKAEVARAYRGEMLDEAAVARATHRSSRAAQIDYLARPFQRRSVATVLDGIADTGLAWRDIARVIGVSVPAVRRWRQGESATPENHMAVARFAALMATLKELGVDDVATWLEMPIDPAAPVTGLDLAAEGKFEDLCEFALDEVTGAELLDAWTPQWRTRYRRGYEVFRAADGELGLRPVPRGEADGAPDT